MRWTLHTRGAAPLPNTERGRGRGCPRAHLDGLRTRPRVRLSDEGALTTPGQPCRGSFHNNKNSLFSPQTGIPSRNDLTFRSSVPFLNHLCASICPIPAYSSHKVVVCPVRSAQGLSQHIREALDSATRAEKARRKTDGEGSGRYEGQPTRAGGEGFATTTMGGATSAATAGPGEGGGGGGGEEKQKQA